MPAATTIDEVLAQLDAIIVRSRARGTADGYFAALYREVTAEVKHRIGAGYFEDGARMERLDVVFANRYLAAYEAFEAGRPASACWVAAFVAARAWRPVVLQHLLLGMNAHINLDLGIAAATVAPGAAIDALQADFNRINAVLCELTDAVETRLAGCWPLLRKLDGFAGGADEAVANFGMNRARDYAWSLASHLAAQTDTNGRDLRIGIADAMATALSAAILEPGFAAGSVLLAVRLTEFGSTAHKLDLLADEAWDTRKAPATGGPAPVGDTRVH